MWLHFFNLRGHSFNTILDQLLQHGNELQVLPVIVHYTGVYRQNIKPESFTYCTRTNTGYNGCNLGSIHVLVPPLMSGTVSVNS